MFHLSNSHLKVSILDPAEDQERFGTRYCTGGYIFQISDHEQGDLLTGPTYPDSFNVFDGQGIPDSFNRAPLRDPTDPNVALVIGVGSCDLASDDVLEFCAWDIRKGDHAIIMRTEQSLGNFALHLQRRVELHGRTVRSTTWLDNKGSVGFQISWFPHPFFPHPEEDELCRVDFPLVIQDNPGYDLSPGGFIARKEWPWTTDYYLALDHNAHGPTTILQRHPKLGLIAGSTSYAPRFFPIWGNPNTFSWEPYFEQSIAPGQGLAWGMTYDF